MTTIDLELAKELQSVCKEKGITMPESYFSHYEDNSGYSYITLEREKVRDRFVAPAYTLDELLEWLPKTIIGGLHFPKTGVREFRWKLSPNMKHPETYDIGYYEYDGYRTIIVDTPNPANAACKLLIWLIKEGLINE